MGDGAEQGCCMCWPGRGDGRQGGKRVDPARPARKQPPSKPHAHARSRRLRADPRAAEACSGCPCSAFLPPRPQAASARRVIELRS